MTLERPMFPPVNSSRRGFLAQAAVVAAGGAALGVALPLPVSAGGSERLPDPIYAAIEAHKAAHAVMVAAVDRHAAFERELQSNGPLQNKYRLEDERRRGDEIEAAIDQACNAEADAACVLVSNPPRSVAGILALLQYAVAADKDGETWPTDLESDDGSKVRSWHYFLVANLVEALPKLMAGKA